jgi:magnesium transporter
VRTLITVGGSFAQPSAQELEEHLARCDKEGFWLDIEAPGKEDYALLRDLFGYHPLTIDDIQQRNERPKLDEYPGYAFVVLFTAEWAGAELVFREQHLYLSRNKLVSVHHEPAPVLAELMHRIKAAPEATQGDPGFLQYLVIDQLVDSLFPILERLDDIVDSLEEAISSSGGRTDVMGAIYHLRHQVSNLRRYLGAQRDLFQRLVSHSIELERRETTLYYRDVYDHLVRQYETVDSLRDLLTGAMDVYLSRVSNTLNSTVKQLTAIASLFLPLTFLTGFFGMNFGFLVRSIGGPASFAAALGLMAATIVTQLYIFRRRGWI